MHVIGDGPWKMSCTRPSKRSPALPHLDSQRLQTLAQRFPSTNQSLRYMKHCIVRRHEEHTIAVICVMVQIITATCPMTPQNTQNTQNLCVEHGRDGALVIMLFTIRLRSSTQCNQQIHSSSFRISAHTSKQATSSGTWPSATL